MDVPQRIQTSALVIKQWTGLKNNVSDIQDIPEGKVNILGGHSIGHSKQKCLYEHGPIPNGFRDRTIW